MLSIVPKQPSHDHLHLSKMMTQVLPVVGRQEPESHGRGGFDKARNVTLIVRNSANNMRQVPVVRMPQRDEIIPRPVLVVLALHPVVLRVGRKPQLGYFLRPHEPLMVVRGRIDQVSDHLLGRPFARRARPRSLRLANRSQFRKRSLNRLEQLGRDCWERRVL
jgi:hypothetical protein